MHDGQSPQVLAVCGSLRAESRTRVALDAVLAASRAAGATTELLDLRQCPVPSLFGTDDPPAAAATVPDRVAAADSVVLGTPTYHGSYSGALKDALDNCGREEFGGTTVGLLEVAAGRFPGSALCHLREVCRMLQAWTLPTEVAIPEAASVVSGDGIEDGDVADRLDRLGTALVDYAGVTAYPDLAAAPGADPTPGDGGRR